MQRIGNHLSFANVAAGLALLFSMTGGAIAATGGFTSGGALRACVNEEGAIRLLKAGKRCKRGQKTVSWNQTGPAGAKGAAGAPGAAGAAGTSGSNGANGTTGFTSTLPRGKTEIGTWAATGKTTGPYYVPISFNIPLLERPEGFTIIGKEAPSTAECPGTVGDPQAASGNLCIYVGSLVGGTVFNFDPDNSGDGVKRYGTILGVKVTAEGALAYGTWAVTG